MPPLPKAHFTGVETEPRQAWGQQQEESSVMLTGRLVWSLGPGCLHPNSGSAIVLGEKLKQSVLSVLRCKADKNRTSFKVTCGQAQSKLSISQYDYHRPMQE